MNTLPDSPNELLPFLITDDDHFETLDRLKIADESLILIAREAVRDKPEWSVDCAGIWTSVRRKGLETPAQGWKIHLSATVLTAQSVLERVLPVLIEHHTPFKFASSPAVVRMLNHAHWPRGGSGKFITIYPRDEAVFASLVEVCHTVTEGMKGPRILSDRRYGLDGIVYYRYGAFTQQTKIDESGFAIQVLSDPEGNPFPDRRNAWFTLPPWVKDPLHSEPSKSERSGGQLLLNDRYEIKSVLRHTNRGGVYQALDHATGQLVVVKEARPDVATDELGRDAVYRLEKECRLLQKLEHTRVTPKVLELFGQGGHVFLAQEMVKGATLRDHITQIFSKSTSGLAASERLALAHQLVQALSQMHRAGIIFRDFTPNNIMIDYDERVRLIDLELATDDVETIPISGGTPAYASPNQLSNGKPCAHDDFFSLGVTLFYIALGRDPVGLQDVPQKRTRSEQIGDLLKLAMHEIELDASLFEAINRCLESPTETALTSQELTRILRAGMAPSLSVSAPSDRTDSADGMEEVQEQISESLSGIHSYLQRSASFDRTDRLWPTHWMGVSADPNCVQYGSAGPIMFLTREGTNQELLANSLEWALKRLNSRSFDLPGLYFGNAGIAWTLYEAAIALDAPQMVNQAIELALQAPTTTLIPDVMHGTAGIGLANLHFWARTADVSFRDRAIQAGNRLIQTATVVGEEAYWPIPPETNIHDFAGKTFYGFAHGNAGIASFFAYLFAITGDEMWQQWTDSAVRPLIAAVDRSGEQAWWTFGPDDLRRWPHWCNGSSGIGTALIRIHRITGCTVALELVKRAANAVMHTRVRNSAVQCHGLAGDGDFLLDLHAITGDQSYRNQAVLLARTIFSRRVYRDGVINFAGEGDMRLQADYGSGMSGIGLFLRRCLTGEQRAFMPDAILDLADLQQ